MNIYMANLTNSNKIIWDLTNINIRLWDLELNMPTKLSQLENDTSFVTNTVNNLTNYYNRQNSYSKSEINDLLTWLVGLSFEVVTELPETGRNWVIYLMLNEWEEENVYDEYVWIDDQEKFEKLWTVKCDFSDYYTKWETDNLLNEKIEKPNDSVETWYWLIKTDEWYDWQEIIAKKKVFYLESREDYKTATEMCNYICESQNYDVWFIVKDNLRLLYMINHMVRDSIEQQPHMWFFNNKCIDGKPAVWLGMVKMIIPNSEVTEIKKEDMTILVMNRLPSTQSPDRLYVLTDEKAIYWWSTKIADLTNVDLSGYIKFWDNQVDDIYTSAYDANWNWFEFYHNSFYVENEDWDVEDYPFFWDNRIARLNETMRWFPVPQRWDDISSIVSILKRNEPVYFYEKDGEVYRIWVVQSFNGGSIRSYMNNKWEYLDVSVNDNWWECDGHNVANADLVYQLSYTWHYLPNDNIWKWDRYSQYRATSSSFTVTGSWLFRMWFEYKLKVKNTWQSTITVTLWNKLLNPRNIPTTIAKWKEVIFLFYSSHNTMATMELAQRIERPIGEDMSNYYTKEEIDELLANL